MMTKIYDLAYEVNGDTISLEQDLGCGDVSRIDLHRIHLRLLAEELGLVSSSSSIKAHSAVARLSRQMRTLCKRIDQLEGRIGRTAATSGVRR